MKNFQLLAHGLDTTGLLLSYKKELAAGGEQELVLYDGTEWAGQFFAMPGLRVLLLNMMRLVEATHLVRVVLWDVSPESRHAPQFELDATEDGLVLCVLQAGHCELLAGAERTQVPAQSILWARIAENNALENLDDTLAAIVVGVYYKQMP